MRASRLLLSVTLAVAASTPRLQAQALPHALPDDGRPSALDALNVPDRTEALDIAPDGRTVAVSWSDGEGNAVRSVVRLLSLDRPDAREVEIPGRVVDLLFVPGVPDLFAIQQRPRKKRAGESYLVRIDLDTLKVRRDVYLPALSHGLAYWPEEQSILIASRREIRTLVLPDLRSGPLFRILGENLSVGGIGGSRILVGQSARLLEVDLSDPPGQDEMPVRAALEVPSPVIDLAIAADGSRGLARLADGSLWSVRTDPLRLEASAETLARTPPEPAAPQPPRLVIEPPTPEEPEPTPAVPRPPKSIAPAPTQVIAQPTAPAKPEPTSVAVEPPLPTTAPPAAVVVEPPESAVSRPTPAEPPGAGPQTGTEPPEARPAEPNVAVEPPAPTPVEPPKSAPSLDPPKSAPAVDPPKSAPAAVAEPRRDRGAGHAPEAQVRGTISGPEAASVAAVVLFGPNNILREAARVTPRADGGWELRGLDPGRYRVVLEGTAGRVLVTDPRFRIIDVTDDAPPLAADFKAQRSF